MTAPETNDTRDISVHLTIRTDLAVNDARQRILAALGDQFDIRHVSAFDLDDLDDADDPEVQLVICPARGLLRVYVDDEQRADQHAKAESAVWAGLIIGGDHRGEVT